MRSRGPARPERLDHPAGVGCLEAPFEDDGSVMKGDEVEPARARVDPGDPRHQSAAAMS